MKWRKIDKKKKMDPLKKTKKKNKISGVKPVTRNA